MKTLINTLILIALSLGVLAQNGTVRGTITDESNGELILFANVLVEGTTTGATSDLDGKYSLNLDPGTYALTVSYIGYAPFKVTDVIVKGGEVTLLDIKLQEAGEMIDEVVVVAKQMRNTEAALMTLQRKSANVMDGISSQSFKKIGDSDAGEAIKRVTGVSVEGGKHVYVRGLGDRYTKTIFNGMDIPGLDPDRNSVQMDIFPTNIIDNIVVFKTFSPDLPGDFTGGVVNVTTKDFPEEETLNISLGAGYNPSMHFNSNYLDYDGGKTDWLGMDDGTRALPFDNSQVIPDVSDSEQNTLLPYLTSQLNGQMASQRRTNNLNKNLSASYGNRKNLDDWTVGYLAGMNYRHETSLFENALYQEYILRDDKFFINRSSSGTLAKENVFWNAIGGMSLKYKSHRLGVQYMRLQNGESSSSKLLQRTFESNPAVIQKDNLEYAERTVNNIIVNGKHSFAGGDFEVDWRVMPTFATIDEPDIRLTAFEIVQNADGTTSYEVRPAVGAEVNRAWRNLKENNVNSKMDFTYKFKLGERDSKLKFGGVANFKERDFEVINYLFRVRQQSQLEINGNADALFGENVWTPLSNKGTYIRGNFEPANTFNARQRVMSAYVMNEMPITEKFKAIYGLRVESAVNYYTGQSNDGQRLYNDTEVLNETNFLPSINLVYELKENMNLRLSGSQTVARPTFKEKSLAQIQDRISGRTFLGNIELEQTNITNADLRWEYFFNPGEMVSVSTFYKHFVNPIELVAFNVVAPNNFQPKNGNDTNLYGIEFEIRKKLDFISSKLTGLNLGFNATLVKSEIEVDGQETRSLVGQSPFIINALLGYANTEKAIDANLSYNVQGERLSIVGIGGVPNVYEQSFNALNFKISKKFGLARKYGVSLSAGNILNQTNRLEYKNDGEDNQTFQLLEPGRNYSISFNWSI